MREVFIDGKTTAMLTGIMAHHTTSSHKHRRIWYCNAGTTCKTCSRTMFPGELYSCKLGITPECSLCWPFRIAILNAKSFPGCLHITHAKRTDGVWKAETN